MSINDLFPTILIMLIPVVILPLAFIFIETSIPQDVARFVRNIYDPPRASEAKIAYKKAFILKGPNHFSGVMGGLYQADSRKNSNSLGFHAYEKFHKALAHNQQGNVLLEVLLSGEIDIMDEGYISEHQRVLQVIPYSCYWNGCRVHPTHFFDSQGNILFSCYKHSRGGRSTNDFKRMLEAFFSSKGYYIANNPRPIAKLPEELPWLKEHNIVVGHLSGKEKFIPTRLKNQEVG